MEFWLGVQPHHRRLAAAALWIWLAIHWHDHPVHDFRDHVLGILLETQRERNPCNGDGGLKGFQIANGASIKDAPFWLWVRNEPAWAWRRKALRGRLVWVQLWVYVICATKTVYGFSAGWIILISIGRTNIVIATEP
jgi:hypothetical protein